MLRRTNGKMVYELRPSADWHKGKAVEWLLEQVHPQLHFVIYTPSFECKGTTRPSPDPPYSRLPTHPHACHV